jgi:hypothetical protein
MIRISRELTIRNDTGMSLEEAQKILSADADGDWPSVAREVAASLAQMAAEAPMASVTRPA